jgi:aspartyl-tRNA(Asn)/glutamyl-tRNA(Gln) amidotransferase subunit A
MGPLTRAVQDAALFLDCVVGYHPSAPESIPHPGKSYVENLDKLSPGLKIAFSPTLGYARVQHDVMTQVEDAVKSFDAMGHHVEVWEDGIPDPADAWATLMNCNSYLMAKDILEEHRKDLGFTLVEVFDQAKNYTTTDFLKCYEVKTELNRILWDLFDNYDLLVTPTMPTAAFAAKGPPPSEIDGHPISLLMAVAFTYPFNLSGHPAASVRAGFTKDGLPVGLQIVGPHYREDLVLQASRAYERERPWNDTWPEVTP